MRRSPRCPWVLAAGLLLASLGDPAPARAGCGDYVVIGSHKGSAGESKPAPATDSMLMRHETPAPAGPARPCSGPGCSQGRPPLAPPPPTAPSVEDERWGHYALAALLPEPGADLLRLPFTPLRPVRGGCSVYHPPR